MAKSKEEWYFGKKPTKKHLIDPEDKYFLRVGDASKLTTVDALEDFFTAKEDENKPGMDILRMMSEPSFIWMATKILTGINLTPLQAAVYQEMYSRPSSLVIGSRGFAKSFGIALVLSLKAALTASELHGGPGFRAVVVGSGFRQSKIIFEYMEKIWSMSTVLQSICRTGRGGDGPYREQDRFTMRINGNTIMAIPVGDGSKIRGLRANMVACLSGDSLVETNGGIIRIKDPIAGKSLVTGDASMHLECPEGFVETHPTDVYEVHLERGFVMRCSGWHRVMTKEGWRVAKDLMDEYIEFKNHYRFPTEILKISVRAKHEATKTATIDEKAAWLLGVLSSEASHITYDETEVKLGGLEEYRFIYDGNKSVKKNTRWDRAIHECVDLDKRYVSWVILRSPRSVVLAYLSGLFVGNKAELSRVFSNDGYISCEVTFTTKHERMLHDVQILLWKLGFLNHRIVGDRIIWSGPIALALADLLDVPYWKPIIKGYRIPVVTKENYPNWLKVDKVIKLKEKQSLYDYILPVTHSFYAEGLRQHNCDEANALSEEIFETVIMGFTATSSDPMANVEYYAKMDYLREKGDIDALRELAESYNVHKNQSIISGTAGYQFQPLYKYFERYRKIIESGGDVQKLKQAMPDAEIGEAFDHRDYSICRIPYGFMVEKGGVKGFMDDASLARSRLTMDDDRFLNEYETIFTKDSTGFFKASVIHANTIKYPLSTIGDRVGENDCLGHLFGMDVASENDRLAIAVLAVYPSHCKLKNIWTTDRASFEKRKELRLTNITDYYGFCVRKARELMQCYPPMRSHPMGAYFAIDKGGGGIAIMEAFHDTSKLLLNEECLYEYRDPTNPKPSDLIQDGDHSLWMVNFSNRDIINKFYYGGKSILGRGKIKFPEWDIIELERAMDADAEKRHKFVEYCDNELVLFDTVEDNYQEIYKCIEELTGIQEERSASGKTTTFTMRGRKNAEGKVVFRHKDRATALLLSILLYQQYAELTDPMDLLEDNSKKQDKRDENYMWNPINQLAIALNKSSEAFYRANEILQEDDNALYY